MHDDFGGGDSQRRLSSGGRINGPASSRVADETGQEIVHRWPEEGSGDIRMGSQLVVRESQAAVFFRDGKALDVFQPGRHTLSTLNLPLLGRIVNMVFGGETPSSPKSTS